jgi:hypothetical protein
MTFPRAATILRRALTSFRFVSDICNLLCSKFLRGRLGREREPFPPVWKLRYCLQETSGTPHAGQGIADTSAGQEICFCNPARKWPHPFLGVLLDPSGPISMAPGTYTGVSGNIA